MHKVRFMILERGPWAFIQGVSKLVRDSICESSTTQGLVITAVSEISKRMFLLSELQHRLAVALGEVSHEHHQINS
jgi:nuclear-control-of-ATPase protein 2